MTIDIDGFSVSGTPEEIERFVKIHRSSNGVPYEKNINIGDSSSSEWIVVEK